jgi:RNA-binding protein Musashi
LSDISPSSIIETSSLQQPTPGSKDALRSLPAKPLSPNSGSLSYSAQIAQQFSAYQQTPSQERQQRTEILSSKRSSTLPANEGSSSAGSPDTVFGKKPSEMHDAG